MAKPNINHLNDHVELYFNGNATYRLVLGATALAEALANEGAITLMANGFNFSLEPTQLESARFGMPKKI